MKKILVLGDNETAKWHPLTTGVDAEIKAILGNDYQIDIETARSSLLKLADYDLLILYTDNWEADPVTDEICASLLTYVANGGPVLAMHAAVCINERQELIQLIGAKFKSHPAIDNITVRATDFEHPITKGLEEFVTFEEPYTYHQDPYSDVTALTEYTHNGVTFINSWIKKYGKGELIYLMNGHTADQFKDEGNRILLKNSVEYLLR